MKISIFSCDLEKLKYNVVDYSVLAWQRECSRFEMDDCNNLILDGIKVGHINSDYGGVFLTNESAKEDD